MMFLFFFQHSLSILSGPTVLSQADLSAALMEASLTAVREAPPSIQADLINKLSMASIGSSNPTNPGQSQVTAPSFLPPPAVTVVGPAGDTQSEARQGGVQSHPAQNTYQISCQVPNCSWKTAAYTDPMVMAALVGYEQNHFQREHQGQDKKSKENDSFAAATTPVQVDGGLDDRVNLLCQGRFLPGVINWKAAARMSPKTQPVFSKLDLSHLGLTVHNERAVRALHDRTSTAIKLEQFSLTNLAKNTADTLKTLSVVGTKIVESSDLVPFTGVKDAIEAAHTWSVLATFIHPQDVGPLAVFRLLFCKNNEKSLDMLACKNFWKKAQADNAHKAERGEPPYSFQELATIWNVGDYTGGQVDKSQQQGYKQAQQSVDLAGMAKITSTLTTLSNKLDSMSQPNRDQKRKVNPPTQSPGKVSKVEICRQFQKPEGCNRAVMEGGKFCHDGLFDRLRMHMCSKPGCGAREHGSSKH
jgi:hypothetical protein